MSRCLRRALPLAVAVTTSLLAPAAAEAATCQVSAGPPPVVRAQGMSELVGDLVVVCSHDGTPPTANGVNTPVLNVMVFLNTGVTSRVLATSAGGARPYFGEPLLVMDEAGSPGVPLAPCQSASGVCQNKGNGTGSGYYVGQPGSNGNVNVFQGTLPAQQNTVLFQSIPFDPPASGQVRVLRFVNLRANANALGSGSINAFVSVSSSISFALSNPQQGVALINPGLNAGVRDAASGAALTGPVQRRSCDTIANERVATMRFGEGFATSFKKRNPGSTLTPSFTQDTATPGVNSQTETGFFSSSLVGHSSRGNLRIAGLPDAGSRLTARFEGVPAGVRLFVDTDSTAVSGAQESAQLTADESQGFTQLPPFGDGPPGTREVALTAGAGTAVWEVTQAAPAQPGAVDIGVYASYPAGTPVGVARVALGLGPGMDPAADGIASPGPLPRFDRTDAVQQDLLEIAACPGGGTNTPGTNPPGTTPAAQDASLSALAVSPSTFRAAGRGSSIAQRRRVGTRVSYTLTAGATVRFFVERGRAGRRVGGRCVAPRPGNRTSPRCRRFTRLRGSFNHSGAAGPNAFRFTGRLGGRALRAGRYRLGAAPVLPGGRAGAVRRAAFRIVG